MQECMNFWELDFSGKTQASGLHTVNVYLYPLRKSSSRTSKPSNFQAVTDPSFSHVASWRLSLDPRWLLEPQASQAHFTKGTRGWRPGEAQGLGLSPDSAPLRTFLEAQPNDFCPHSRQSQQKTRLGTCTPSPRKKGHRNTEATTDTCFYFIYFLTYFYSL